MTLDEQGQALKKLIAEAAGTFAMVFGGTGAIVVYSGGGANSPLAIALAFGVVVMIVVYALRDVSGAHINPAVTIGLWIAGKHEAKMVMPYVAAQCVGAIMASAVLRLMFGNGPTDLGTTLPHGSPLRAFALETIMTAFLLFVILAMTKDRKDHGIVGLVIGATIFLEALVAGPITGASMNPARSLAPAIVSWNLAYLSLYVVAPVLGAALMAVVWRVGGEPGRAGA